MSWGLASGFFNKRFSGSLYQLEYYVLNELKYFAKEWPERDCHSSCVKPNKVMEGENLRRKEQQ